MQKSIVYLDTEELDMIVKALNFTRGVQILLPNSEDSRKQLVKCSELLRHLSSELRVRVNNPEIFEDENVSS